MALFSLLVAACSDEVSADPTPEVFRESADCAYYFDLLEVRGGAGGPEPFLAPAPTGTTAIVQAPMLYAYRGAVEHLIDETTRVFAPLELHRDGGVEIGSVAHAVDGCDYSWFSATIE